MRSVLRFGEINQRGVYVAPWMGPDGEIVLIAITSRRRKLIEEMIPRGADHVAFAVQVQAMLDEADPDTRPTLRLA
jgi:hypothetical protein